MRSKVLLLIFFLEYFGVEARPEITSFSLLQGSTRWDIGEPRFLPDLSDIEALMLPRTLDTFKSPGFTYCNKLLTLVPHEVFTLTLPVDQKSCLIYLKAPKGYLVEQRGHPIMRFFPCDREQLRFSSDQTTLVYCDGGYALHFPSDQDYVAIMYEGTAKAYRKEIKLAVTVKPVASSLPGSSQNVKTGTSEILWRDPEAEYEPVSVLQQARQDKTLQICPEKCGASEHDGSYSRVSATTLEAGELPYMVRVEVHYKSRGNTAPIRITCGGSILNSRSVLTAAHCVLDKEKQRWKVIERMVYTGNFDANDEKTHGQAIRFDEFVVHPQYRHRMADDATKSFRAFDIAVLKLEEDIQLGPYSWTICLSPPLDFMNKHAIVTGYGRANADQHSLDKGDRYSWKAGVVIADYDKKCRESDRFRFPKNEYRKACSFGLSREACIGDAGSPLAVADGSVWYQVGVATGGFCGSPGEPHFHVNVTTFGDFIRKNVRSGRCN